MSLKLITTILRILLGALFLWSGIQKIYDPIRFSEFVRNYELIGDPWVAVAAVSVPIVEIVAGICLMAGCWLLGGLSVTGLMLVVFTSAIAISWARGLEIACGCFSLDESITNYPLKIAENLILMGVTGWLWLKEPKNNTGPTPATAAAA